MSWPVSQLAQEAVREDVRQQLDEVLGREQFQWDRESLLERAFGWLNDNLSLPDLPASWSGLEWIVLAPLLAAAVWALVRLVRHVAGLGAEPEAGANSGPDLVAQRVAELIAAARTARAAGDLRLALRRYFFALVVGLGGRGDLEYRDTWTNRELLERGGPSAEVSALLRPLVADLDAKGFGRVPTSEADVARLEQLCERWLPTLGGGL